MLMDDINNNLTTQTGGGATADSLDRPEDVVTNAMTQLPFENLIGGPLSACVLAQRQAAETTREFIEDIGFQKRGESDDLEVISISFLFQQNGIYKKLSVPLLTIVPIPYMTIDSIDIGFRADMTATKEGKLYGTFSNARDSSAVKASKYDIRNQIDVNIHATSSNMPPGIAALLDIFGNQCIQVNDLSLNEMAKYDQETREKIAKKQQEINEYGRKEAEKIEKEGDALLKDVLKENDSKDLSDKENPKETEQTSSQKKYSVRLLKYPSGKTKSKVVAAFMNSCTSQKLTEEDIINRMKDNLNRTIVTGLTLEEAFRIEKAVDATGCDAKVVEM